MDSKEATNVFFSIWYEQPCIFCDTYFFKIIALLFKRKTFTHRTNYDCISSVDRCASLAYDFSFQFDFLNSCYNFL